MKRLVTHRRQRIGSMVHLKKHPFFAGIQWDSLRTIENPPFVPQLESEIDTTYFDDFNDPDNIELYKEVHNKHKDVVAVEGNKNSRAAFVGFTFRHKHVKNWKTAVLKLNSEPVEEEDTSKSTQYNYGKQLLFKVI